MGCVSWARLVGLVPAHLDENRLHFYFIYILELAQFQLLCEWPTVTYILVSSQDHVCCLNTFLVSIVPTAQEA